MRVIVQTEALRRSEGGLYHHFIHELPTIDAEPVRHARWDEGSIQGYPHVICSNCKKEAIFRNAYEYYAKTPYCPHCGAKMDGKEG